MAAALPNVPVVSTPLVVVIIGKLAVVPIAPPLLMLPCVWANGVRASLNLLSVLLTASVMPYPASVVGVLVIVDHGWL